MDDDRAFALAAAGALPAMRRLAGSIVGASRAEEAAQEACLRAWRYLGSFDGRGSFEGWLMSICRRVAIDMATRPRPPLAHESVPAACHGEAVALEGLVASLGDDERDAFSMTQLAGLSYAETAAALQIPIGTVRSRVARARRTLMAQLKAAAAS